MGLLFFTLLPLFDNTNVVLFKIAQNDLSILSIYLGNHFYLWLPFSWEFYFRQLTSILFLSKAREKIREK